MKFLAVTIFIIMAMILQPLVTPALSFWSPYNQIYGCSGFNSDWCNNTGFTKLGANTPTSLNSLGLSNGNYQP